MQWLYARNYNAADEEYGEIGGMLDDRRNGMDWKASVYRKARTILRMIHIISTTSTLLFDPFTFEILILCFITC